MMKANFNIKHLLLLLVAFTFSCETTELDILDNPNFLQPDEFSADLLLNQIQIDTAVFFEQVTEEGQEVTRIIHGFGPDYFSGYGPGQLNNAYTTLYARMLPDINTLLGTTEEEGLTVHSGMAQVLQAYALMTMVDYLGDIPLSETGLGLELDNPNLDPDEQVYAEVANLLRSAINNLSTETPIVPNTDLYYPMPSGAPNVSSWITLANTLLLKLNLQTRLVNPDAASNINEILGNGVILSSDLDFQFQYGTNDLNPDNRHPIFSRNYDAGVTDYQSNHFMNLLVNGFDNEDPRTRFYFYRQSAESGDDTTQNCINQVPPPQYDTDDAFCVVFSDNTGEGAWWGREHFDAQGIPPDDGLRTNWGLYPVGGLFDDDTFEVTNSRDQGAQGAGISPILLSSFVNFMLAESALTLNTNGNAEDFLEQGMRQSITKVINFANIVADPQFLPQEIGGDLDIIEPYIEEVLENYEDATSDAERLEIVIEQYYIALYGNGVEAYNTYRRTGFPSDLQPALNPSPGVFVRSFLFPQTAVDTNSNINQKPDQTVPVFWDTNPEGFVD